jgi:UDPglucose 6-dehydrogenase
MIKKSIAVIGQGFVGGSITTVFAERGFNVHVYDNAGKVAQSGIKLPKTFDTTSFVNECEKLPDFAGIFFVCLPTPMYDDGEADLSIVEGVLTELSAIPGERIAIVKSTVPPGSTERWNKMFATSGLRVVFNPEFLTEANALNDMRNQNRIVLGGPRPHINTVKQLFQTAFPNVPIVKTSSSTAEMVKYFTNIQLAARVVLSCELWQICNVLDSHGLDVDYDKVVEYAKYDQRLGGSHMSVPGHDGIPGARGHCFPKDLSALIFQAKAFGFDPKLLNAIKSKNLDLVPQEHRDWEKMVGRAFKKRNG